VKEARPAAAAVAGQGELGSGSQPDLSELLSESAWLERLAYRLVRDADLADELVQDTWLALLRKPPREGVPLRPWMVRVMKNLFRRLGRRRAPSPLEADPVARRDPSPEGTEMAGLVVRLVDGLSEPMRSTVVLRYFEDLDATEISRLHGVTAGTVRWRLKQALDGIRDELDVRHDGDRRAWCLGMAPLLRRRIALAEAASAGTGVGLGGLLLAAGVIGLSGYLLLDMGAGRTPSTPARAVSVAPLDSEVPARGEELFGPTAEAPRADAAREVGPSMATPTAAQPAEEAALASRVSGELWGVVRDASGAPVADCEVQIRRDAGTDLTTSNRSVNGPASTEHGLTSVVTNEAGEFRTSKLESDEYVRAYARTSDSGWGWSEAARLRARVDTGPLTIELPERRSDELDLEVRGVGGGAAHDLPCVYWDESTWYRMGQVLDGRLYLNTGRGVQTVWIFDPEGEQGFAVLTGRELAAEAVALAPQPRVALRATDAAGRAVAGARAAIRRESQAGIVLARAEGRADEPLSIPVLPDVELVASVVAPGYAETHVPPFRAEASTLELRVTLDPLPEWFGRVTAAGRPVANAEVRLHPGLAPPFLYRTRRGFPLLAMVQPFASDVTGADGRFQATFGFEEIHYFATYRAPGYPWHFAGPFRTRRLETLEDSALELRRGGSIRGRLTASHSDAEFAGLTVGLANGGPHGREAITETDGTFAFEDVAPGDWYLFPKAAVDGEHLEAMGARAVPRSYEYPSNCTVVEDAEVYVELSVDTLVPGRVTGTLDIAHGSPAGWGIQLYSGPDDPFRPIRSVQGYLGSDGRFDLVSPDSGSYVLSFRAPGGREAELFASREIHVSEQVEPLEVRWSLGALEVEVAPDALPPGLPVVGVTRAAGGFRGSFDLLLDEERRFALDEVPVGQGRLCVWHPGDSETDSWTWPDVLAEFEIVEGETAFVVIE